MEIQQSFLKGINRSVSRDEFFNPDFFWSTQNARILQSGNLGEVVRIKGYNQISNELSDLDTLYDMVLVNNSAVGTTNNYVVFYKDTSNDYRVKIFNDSGTLQDSFSYSSSVDLGYGELKQHSNSIFIAPHNKILYGIGGSFYLKDFISQIPTIDSIGVLSEDEQTAEYNLTVNQQLSSGYGGRKAFGYIMLWNNNIPPTVEESFYIKIGADTSDLVGPFTNLSTQEILTEIKDTINGSATLSSWTATVQGRLVKIESNTVGESSNDTTIDIVNAQISTFEKREQIIGPIGNNIGEPTSTFVIQEIDGGVEAGNVYGSARVSIKDAVVTSPIQLNSTDTTSDIASKLETILSEDKNVTQDYNISRTSNVVNIEAKKAGNEYNTNVVITINESGGNIINVTDNFVSLTQVREGRDSSTTGTIKRFTNYWYTARFRFTDGHITKTCPPRLVNSEAGNPITINFDIPINDLDDTYPRLQVFRKESNDDFYLIEEVDLDQETVTGGSFTYQDDGLSVIEPLKEVSNVWTKSHKTEEIIDNRLVKANNTFFVEEYDASNSDFTITTGAIETGSFDIAPYNSKATIYTRPQYEDGSLGYHKKIGTVNVESEEERIGIQQTSLVNNTDKTISELKFYARYLPFGKKENLRFGTSEIISRNLASIEDPFLYSDVTKVFFGFKYVIRYDDYIYTNIEGWGRDGYKMFEIAELNTNEARIESERLYLTVHGEEFTYIPVAKHSNDTFTTQTVYKLEMFDALQNGISTGSLNIQLKKPAKDGMSDRVSDDVLRELQINVTGIDDKTNGIEKFDIQKIPIPVNGATSALIEKNVLVPPNDNRIYLTLEESRLDEIDNQKINRVDYKWEEELGDQLVERFPNIDIIETGTVAFEILNFELKNQATFNTSNTAQHVTEKGTYDVIRISNSDEAVYYLINRQLTFEDNVIYLGSKENSIDGSTVFFDTTGFTHKPRANLFYSVLASHNIYETLFQESDFNIENVDFANQIIWSNPLLDNNYYSGGRNFAVTNFYNLSTENGDIVQMVSLNGNLYVFCEKGVARLLVGETLTQQKSGQVFVDSSGFITKHIWILEDLPDIKVNSIVKVDNAILFTDGVDVYKITNQGVQNISLGKINVEHDIDYQGSIAKFYNEYRLGNPTTGESLIYNFKYDQWYGPYTYVPRKSIDVNGKTISYVGGLVEENVGNTFNGTNYNTLIQSVGNDTEVGHYMKTYRRFYVSADEVTGSTLEYGKDYTSLVSKSFDNFRSENGQYKIGILNSEGNSRKIYWDITSNNENFSLKSFSTLYDVRRRR